MTMRGKATKIGVATASMSEMTVDLVGPGGTFGRLDVPAIKMGSFGANITIIDQLVEITDMKAFKSFLAAIMQDDSLLLRLENGEATVKALGTKSNIVYRKNIHLRGLQSLKIGLIKTETRESITTSTFIIDNPSHFDVDLGIARFEVQDGQGCRIAGLKGSTYLKQGTSELNLSGPSTGATLRQGEARLVGVDVDEDNWLMESIHTLNKPVAIPTTMYF